MQAVRSPSVPPWKLWSQNRWLVFVPSLWIQACAGVAYAYGSYSPLLKTVLGYNQQQISFLGIAKDVGASVGLPAGSLSEVLPPWCLITIGALHSMVGYGGLWLIVTGRLPILPMWAVCILILMGSNGDTYLSTAGVVTNVYNFPKSRGHVVGLLKGFNGICSALYTQIYMTFLEPDQGSFLLVVAVGPTVISVLTMFFVRRIDSQSELDGRPSDTLGFYFIYAISLMMAAYLMGVLILQGAITVGFSANLLITVGLLAMMSLPLVTPLLTWAADQRRGRRRRSKYSICPASAIGQRTADDAQDVEAPLLGGYGESKQKKDLASGTLITSCDGAGKNVNTPCTKPPGKGRIMEGEAADGSEMDQKAQEPTLWQALRKVDLWLLFCAIICGGGTGMAAIDNMGQISQSQGYESSSIFVSMTSIFNFLGRILGGYISEVLARTYKLPRSWAMVLFQGMMVVGHILIAWGGPGALYVSTMLVGAGYGSHWGIALPILSELFGMRNFGILYNVSTMAIPIAVLLFSGLLTGYFYDLEAAKQHQTSRVSTMLASVATATSCSGAVCFRFSFFILSGACVVGIFLTIILSIRTRSIYRTMYV